MSAISHRSPRFARFLPALAVLMIGCAWLAAAATTTTRGDREEAFALKGQSLQRTFEYTVQSGTVGIEVELEASISGGAISGPVIDPRGKERMALPLERGNGRGSTGKVEALPGVWRLEVAAADASGR